MSNMINLNLDNNIIPVNFGALILYDWIVSKKY